jgi:hypothetical protein
LISKTARPTFFELPGLFCSWRCRSFIKKCDAAASLKNAIPPLKYWHLILNGKKRTARVVLSAATPSMTQIGSVARETAQ